jgi:hypothetical protein
VHERKRSETELGDRTMDGTFGVTFSKRFVGTVPLFVVRFIVRVPDAAEFTGDNVPIN